jgi:hypothetical protein
MELERYKFLSCMEQNAVLEALDSEIFAANYYLQKNLLLDRMLGEALKAREEQLVSLLELLEQEKQFRAQGADQWMAKGYVAQGETGDDDVYLLYDEEDTIIRLVVESADGTYYAGEPFGQDEMVLGHFVNEDGSVQVGTFLGEHLVDGLFVDKNGVMFIGSADEAGRAGLTLIVHTSGLRQLGFFVDGELEGLSLLYDENGLKEEWFYEKSMKVMPFTERK